jgi:hypothetical protein
MNNRHRFTHLAIGLVLVGALAAGQVMAQSMGEPGRNSAKPNPLNNVYFGEQHLHTSASPIWYTPEPKLVKKLDFYPGLQERLSYKASISLSQATTVNET